MSIRPYRDILRRKSRQIFVGPVAVGGDAPITVQSMTNTDTADARATIDQVRQLAEGGRRHCSCIGFPMRPRPKHSKR